jgi:hypothetical protein
MPENKRVHLLIIVASLGYFVDIYDLIVFNVVNDFLGMPTKAFVFVGEMSFIEYCDAVLLMDTLMFPFMDGTTSS